MTLEEAIEKAISLGHRPEAPLERPNEPEYLRECHRCQGLLSDRTGIVDGSMLKSRCAA